MSGRGRGWGSCGGRCRDTREHAGISCETALSHAGVFGIEFYQDGVAAEPITDEAGGAGSSEGIEDGSADRAAGSDAAFCKLFRKCGTVARNASFVRDVPHAVFGTPCPIEPVAPRLRQQEKI